MIRPPISVVAAQLTRAAYLAEHQVASVSAAVSPTVTTLDLRTARSFAVTLGSGNAVLDLVGGPLAGEEFDVRIKVTQDATGSRTITLTLDGVSVPLKGPFAAVPTLASGASKRTDLHLVVGATAITVKPAGREIA